MSGPKIEMKFNEVVEDHFNKVNDANWGMLEETGIMGSTTGGDVVVGVCEDTLLPIVENLATHLSIWIEFAKQIGVPEHQVLALVKKGTESGRKQAIDMGEVFSDEPPTSN